MAQDPSCIPDWLDPELGTPFVANEKTVGNYQCYIYDGEPLSVREFFNRPVHDDDQELGIGGDEGVTEHDGDSTIPHTASESEHDTEESETDFDSSSGFQSVAGDFLD
eukprot:CAMPEP_0184679122 /NCGR_PEP_ID=MMETSP0312-20130426/1947_1 /TAXON_ID=31354 /ORGANISM="Compsopogon coeruleus, Strain SAG 36.94" /LENGTH=107 /DNA_ID=CAMNT_0027128367 /DNA_START=494 /DNA_END=817 /DNA_ORIENTATION=-